MVTNGNATPSCDKNKNLPTNPSLSTANTQNQSQQENSIRADRQSEKPRPTPQGSSSPSTVSFVDNRTVITATTNKNKSPSKNQAGVPGVVELSAKQAHLHEQIIEQITKQKQHELLKQQQQLIQLKVQEEVQKQLRQQAQKMQQQQQQQQQKQQQQQNDKDKKPNLIANPTQKAASTQNRSQSKDVSQNNVGKSSSPNTRNKATDPRVESPARKVKEQNNNLKINNKVLQPQLNNIISHAQQSIQNEASQGKKVRKQVEIVHEHTQTSGNSQTHHPSSLLKQSGQPAQNPTVIQNGMGVPVKIEKQTRSASQGQGRSGETTPRKQDSKGRQEDSPPSDQVSLI